MHIFRVKCLVPIRDGTKPIDNRAFSISDSIQKLEALGLMYFIFVN